MRLLTLNRTDGLIITADWDPAQGQFNERVSGELMLVATAGEDIVARERHSLYVMPYRLQDEAKARAEALERKVRQAGQ